MHVDQVGKITNEWNPAQQNRPLTYEHEHLRTDGRSEGTYHVDFVAEVALVDDFIIILGERFFRW